MNTEKVDVTGLNDDGVTWTSLATLYLRAWESRAERSILGDHYAAEALDRIDYDFATLGRRLRPQANQFLVALRARQLDVWSADFLARHSDATVLQLGCGLDSRMLRLSPPPGVSWFDLDEGEVRTLLQRLTGRFGPGELVFDAMTPWVTRMVKVFRWGIRDGREIERWNPRLRCVAQVPFTTLYAKIPVRRYRLLYRLGNGIPVWRNMLHEFRFTF